MKIKYYFWLLLAMMALPVFAQPSIGPARNQPLLAPSTNAPPPDKEKANQFIGQFLARQYLAAPEIKELVDYDILLKAMKDYAAGKPELTDAEMTTVSREIVAYQAAQRQVQAAAQKKKGEDFLAENAKEDGVKVLPSGLQYKVIKEGNGPHPTSNDWVSITYKGSFIDGTVFDHKDEAWKTPLMGFINGWKQALPMMATGAEWKLFVPPNMGYGPAGRPPLIPGNSVLVFDITLLGVEAPPAAPGPRPTLMPMPGSAPGPSANVTAESPQSVSGPIIRVPSKEEYDRGVQPQVIQNGQTNTVPVK